MKDGYLVARDLNIHYLAFGDGSSMGRLPAMLFLHGWRCDAAIWDDIPEHFARKGFAVYALDLPGFGKSEVPNQPLTVADYADVVSGFIQKLNLGAVVLVGHSFGGKVAINVAARFPHAVSKLVLVNSSGIRSGSAGKAMKRLAAKVLKVFFLPPFMCGVRAAIYRFIGAGDYLATPELRQTFLNIISEDALPLLPQIPAPTLILWGGKDKETPVSDARTLAAGIKNSRLTVWRDSGHFGFLEKKSEFIAEVEKFISSS